MIFLPWMIFFAGLGLMARQGFIERKKYLQQKAAAEKEKAERARETADAWTWTMRGTSRSSQGQEPDLGVALGGKQSQGHQGQSQQTQSYRA